MSSSSRVALAFALVLACLTAAAPARAAAPVLTPGGGPAPVYAEGSAGVLVDPDLGLANDSGNGGSATVTITGGYDPHDGFSFVAPNNLRGIQHGAVFEIGPGYIDDVREALRSLRFFTTTQSPSEATRTITVTASNGATSNTLTYTVAVEAADTPPQLGAGPATDFVEGWGPNGSGDGEFDQARGVDVDAAGFVYVADGQNQRVQKFTPHGQFVASIGAGGGYYGLQSPDDVAIARNGDVLVADYQNARIVRYDGTTGAFKGQPLFPAGSMQFNPSAIDVAPTGDIWATDAGMRRVVHFSAEGQLLGEFGGAGPGGVVFDHPTGIAAAADGTVWVIDQANRLRHFSPAGVELGSFGSEGSGPDQFQWPDGVAIDPVGHVHVGDTYNGRIQRLSPTGVFEGPFGTSGIGPGQFPAISGLRFDAAGDLLVTSAYLNGVQRFRAPALTATEGTPASAGALEIADPDGAELTGATVALAGPAGKGDRLTFSDANGIAGTYLDGTLTLTGTAPVAAYQSALRSVAFVTGDDPGTAARTLTFRVSDAGGTSAPLVRPLTVTPVDDPPGAGADTLATGEETEATLAAPGVLANDTDPEGDDLAVTSVDQDPDAVGVATTTARGAQVTIDANGAVRYDPRGAFDALAAGATTTDTVGYEVGDGTATTSGTLTITLTGTNDAPRVLASAGSIAYTENGDPVVADPAVTVQEVEGEPVTGSVAVTSPAPGDTLAYATTAGVTGTVNAAGDTVTFATPVPAADLTAAMRAVTYASTSERPQGAARGVRFRAEDGAGASDAATRSLAITGTNDPPAAAADTLAAGEDATATLAAPGVLGNDTDPDAEDLRVAAVEGDAANVGATRTTALGGKVRIGEDGAVSYDPRGAFDHLAAGQTLDDVVHYTATDGVARSAATLTVTITGADDGPVPVPSSGALAYTEQAAPTAVDPGLEIDDPDDPTAGAGAVALTGPARAGDRLAYATTAGVAGTVAADGRSVTFAGPATPADLRAAMRAVTFENPRDDVAPGTRTVAFATGGADPVTRDVVVTAVDDAPVAGDDTLAALEDTVVRAPAPAVLANDADPDGDAVHVEPLAVTTPKGARVTIAADGAVTYDPQGAFEALAAGQAATDTVTYRVLGAGSAAGTGTLRITVAGADDPAPPARPAPAPAAPAPPRPVVVPVRPAGPSLGAAALQADARGRVLVRFACGAAPRCSGIVSLRSGGHAIGRRAFSDATSARVTLSRAARRTLARAGRLRVTVAVFVRGAGGAPGRKVTRTLTVRR